MKLRNNIHSEDHTKLKNNDQTRYLLSRNRVD